MEFTREELELIKKRIATRKMEAQWGGGGGGGASGEMRKIHIIYFLSRKGRTEHPHLIKVHHLSRNGVRLRDVKRWLSELRGKDMPESFAWSYKRRYKTGYLWQDLLDEDLITPISDNEYVLKGSEIPSLDLYLRSPSRSRASFQEDEVQEHRKSTMEAPKNSTCEIEEESPTFGSEASTVTDDSTKLEEEKNISGENKPVTPRKSDKIDNSSSFYSSLLNKNNSKKTKKNDASNPTSAPAPPPPTPRSSQFTKSKSYSANVFRNLLTCGAVDANETAMMTINRREKNSSHINPPKKPADVENINAGYGNAARICRGDKLGGSERVFRTSWHHEQKAHPDARKSCDGGKSSSNSSKGEFNNLKPVSAYKPINGPNCSQCGKMFKPEKLHKHMKSCRGMKSLAKGATSASVLETRRSSVDSACQESVPGYFLTDGSEFQ